MHEAPILWGLGMVRRVKGWLGFHLQSCLRAKQPSPPPSKDLFLIILSSTKILSEAHDSPVGGHGGYSKTLKRVMQFFSGLIWNTISSCSSKIAWSVNNINMKLRLQVVNCTSSYSQPNLGRHFPWLLCGPAFFQRFRHHSCCGG